MNSNPRGAVLVCTKPALASKTPMYGSGATVACARRCSSIALQVAFARFLISAQTKVNTVQTLTGLQTCAKMLQRHLSGGGGTPWMQPKSNGKFKLAL